MFQLSYLACYVKKLQNVRLQNSFKYERYSYLLVYQQSNGLEDVFCQLKPNKICKKINTCCGNSIAYSVPAKISDFKVDSTLKSNHLTINTT